jgi:hypothetical protein
MQNPCIGPREELTVSVSSDNPTGADNQQGRLEAYLSGFVDGEGCFSVGVQRRPDLPFGYQLVPEFRVSQNAERATVLQELQRHLGCGRIAENDRKRASDKTFVLVVRRRQDLRDHVIPFFQRNPLLSDKRTTFNAFAEIVSAMSAGEHLTRAGFERLVRLAFTMNGRGQYRKVPLVDVVGSENPQRLYAEHLTCTEVAEDEMKIQSELHGDMQSQAEMTWSPATASSPLRQLTEVTELSVPIRCARRRLEEGCP